MLNQRETTGKGGPAARPSCADCGNVFPPRRTGGRPQRYCSAACKQKAETERRTARYRAREFTCRRCGAKFHRDEQHARQLYCSDACRLADDREQRSTFAYERQQTPEHIAKRTAAMLATLAQQVRTCAECGAKFTPTSSPQRYCSGKCWTAVANRRRKPVDRPSIGKDEYDRLLAEQDGKCGICKAPNNGRHRLAADHDHATKRRRGLLCHRCNTAIGLFRDDPALLQAAIDYLGQFAEAS